MLKSRLKKAKSENKLIPAEWISFDYKDDVYSTIGWQATKQEIETHFNSLFDDIFYNTNTCSHHMLMAVLVGNEFLFLK